jgi:hypothetical protein
MSSSSIGRSYDDPQPVSHPVENRRLFGEGEQGFPQSAANAVSSPLNVNNGVTSVLIAPSAGRE